MSTKNTINIWGCTISANIFAATGDSLTDFVICGVWLCFGAAVFVSSKLNSKRGAA